MDRPSQPFRVAVIGGGIAGLSAAWLLSQAHDVTLFEKAPRLGGHSLTVDVPGGAASVPVDMGFIVYNPPAYPNLTALFDYLDVPTQETEMSFAASLRGGALEYSGTDMRALFAQARNLVRPRFWSMLRDTLRFYRAALRDAATLDPELSLTDYLRRGGYGQAFLEDHLLPMAAAIWSTPASLIGDYPAAAFIRFCANHGLLQITNRPPWRTVTGGSREYVRRLAAAFTGTLRLGCGITTIRRDPSSVWLRDSKGGDHRFDHVVIGAHADQALAMLSDPTDAESRLLGCLRYGPNPACLHQDPRLMPRRRLVWSSWNYLERDKPGRLCATYWMNRLQDLPTEQQIFVTLNPDPSSDPAGLIRRETFEHPLFDSGAMRAQRELWQLQGQGNTWFCGAYFGAGFHEDGLQAGLAVAEALGGLRRPWTTANPSGRLPLASAA